MRGTRKGLYWTTHVHRMVLQDAERFGLPEHLVNELVEQFHELGDVEDPTALPGVTRLQEHTRLRVLRRKTHNPMLLAHTRSMILQFGIKGDGHLFLVGIFARCPETYSVDIPERLKALA